MLVAYDSLDPALKKELPITRSNTGELAVKFVRHDEAKTNAMFAGTHAPGRSEQLFVDQRVGRHPGERLGEERRDPYRRPAIGRRRSLRCGDDLEGRAQRALVGGQGRPVS